MVVSPGMVVLFGSGETSASSGKAHEQVAASLPKPLRIAVLETPAGFELNSERVAGAVADFLNRRLQNYQPEVQLVAARKRGTPYSPDLPAVVDPLLDANLIFLGPGSPTYARRQLQGSLAYHYLVARQRQGAALVLASAATLAMSALTLPVYEIYKVGQDPHWQPGLDFFSQYGLRLVFIPHWNNSDGGAELDTSRCYIGRARFDPLLAMLPADMKVVGLDEHTALGLDFAHSQAEVFGVGGVTLLDEGGEERFETGDRFPLSRLGAFRLPEAEAGLPAGVWGRAVERQTELNRTELEIPVEVHALVEARQAARQRKDWAASDNLRQQIEAAGWLVKDTRTGPELQPK